MTQQVFRQKVAYLEILIENIRKGLTANEVSDFYFQDVDPSTTRKALTRLYKNGDARRTKIGRTHRYWVSEKGLLKYDYLMAIEEESYEESYTP